MRKRMLLIVGLLLGGPGMRMEAGEALVPGAERSKALQVTLDQAVARTLAHFADSGVRPDQLAVTLLDLTGDKPPRQASHRGQAQVYPASVIKLFYLVAAHQWLEEGRLEPTTELRRALRDMIVDSSNDATHYVIDLLTGTTSGPELSEEAMAVWYGKRNAVNRYFQGLGYQRVNANRKPWCEGPYGRETQSIRMHKPHHRNMLTTDETARLLWEVASGRAVNRERSQAMMELMRREPSRESGFLAGAVGPGDRLWAKAGWTSRVRHDAGYIELEEGARLVLVIFTERHAGRADLIPFLGRTLLETLR